MLLYVRLRIVSFRGKVWVTLYQVGSFVLISEGIYFIAIAFARQCNVRMTTLCLALYNVFTPLKALRLTYGNFIRGAR